MTSFDLNIERETWVSADMSPEIAQKWHLLITDAIALQANVAFHYPLLLVSRRSQIKTAGRQACNIPLRHQSPFLKCKHIESVAEPICTPSSSTIIQVGFWWFLMVFGHSDIVVWQINARSDTKNAILPIYRDPIRSLQSCPVRSPSTFFKFKHSKQIQTRMLELHACPRPSVGCWIAWSNVQKSPEVASTVPWPVAKTLATWTIFQLS